MSAPTRNAPEICRRCGRLSLPGKTITIAVEEYEALLRRGEPGPPPVPTFRAVSRSGIARDPELARFVLDRATPMLAGEIEAAAVETFGRDRVPSRSAIYRFVRDVQEAGLR